MADTKALQSLLGADSEATQRLKEELRAYLMAQAVRMLTATGRKLGESTLKLHDIAEGNSPGFAKLAREGGRKLAEGKGPVRGALEIGTSHLKDNVLDAVKGLGGKREKGGAGDQPSVIIEHIDVGVPAHDAYDQWTRRSGKAHITEQVPDTRIAWACEGGKGTAKAVVTFHPLSENLTRVLLVMEYCPKGLVEKTGTLWRAQDRRARQELRHFARHVAFDAEDENADEFADSGSRAR